MEKIVCYGNYPNDTFPERMAFPRLRLFFTEKSFRVYVTLPKSVEIYSTPIFTNRIYFECIGYKYIYKRSLGSV